MSLRTGTRNRGTISQIAPAAILSAVLLASEAAAQMHAVPITDPGKVYVLDGLRVLPPPGKNWFELLRDRQLVEFGKRIASPTHSFGVTAASGVIDEKFKTREQLQDYVNKLRTADFDAARYRVIEFDSTLDNTFAAWCVRYRLKRTDRDAVLARNRTLLLEDFGVTCLHPEKKDLVVDVGYSERGRPAEFKTELSTDLRKEGESFMRSIEFTRP